MNWSISNGIWSKQSDFEGDEQEVVGEWASPIWKELSEDPAGEYVDGVLGGFGPFSAVITTFGKTLQ